MYDSAECWNHHRSFGHTVSNFRFETNRCLVGTSDKTNSLSVFDLLAKFTKATPLRVGKFYPHAVLTMVKTPVKTRFGKTPKTRMSWAKLGKTNFLNSKNASYFHILFINL